MTTPAIQVRDLVKRFDDVTAVNGISFEIASGTCVGLLGPNGAGKTTTVELLEGLQTPTSGEVRLFGLSWTEAADSIRSRIGVSLQETKFYEKLTVEETVRLFRSFYPAGLTAEQAVKSVQLEEKRNTQLFKLSGGQQQRLALAVALASDPELLFLDEPTTGLDPQSRRSLWDVIDGLKGRGRTVLLTTHYMEEAAQLCDRIIVVDRGRIVADGSVPELISSIGGEQVIELTSNPRLSPEDFTGVSGLSRLESTPLGLSLTVSELHVAVPAVLEAVRARGAQLEKLSTREATLDDVFLNLTGRRLREEDAS